VLEANLPLAFWSSGKGKEGDSLRARFGARQKNIGWRIDYFLVSNPLMTSVSDSFIMPNEMGSDHCPVGILLK
jgi:exonuclease III